MPFALILIGVVLISAGARNRLTALGTLLGNDFSGPGNFFYWLAGLGAISAIGSVDELRTPSRMFLFLVLLGMMISDRGFFAKLTEALETIQAPEPSSVTDVGIATPDKSVTPKTDSEFTADAIKSADQFRDELKTGIKSGYSLFKFFLDNPPSGNW